MTSWYSLFVILISPSSSEYIKCFVDFEKTTGEVVNFWDSTGFSSPGEVENVAKYLLSKDVHLNLALISSLPNNGIQYVRIHWLLDLIKLRKQKDVCCNFSSLDIFLDRLVSLGLKPGFEIMGNPYKIVSREKTNTFINWGDIVHKTIKRYIDRYGTAVVSTWRFETWNEPDLKKYNILNFTLTEYLEYVTSTIIAVRSFDVEGTFRLKLGGPAGLFKTKSKHPLCWGFLKFCNNCKSLCDFDFLSFHKKGNGSSSKVVSDSILLKQQIIMKFPNLSTIPIINDEADILSGWWKHKFWRGDVHYAAAVIRVIYLLHSLETNNKLGWISNDNAFLNAPPHYFTQRTLMARFVMNNTRDQHSQFFKKPIFSVMALLALIDGLQVRVHCSDSRVYILATKSNDCGKCFCSSRILITPSNEKIVILKEINNLIIEISFPNKCIKLVVQSIYMLSNHLPHPKKVWESFGQPKFPNISVRQEMRKSEGPHRISSDLVQLSSELVKVQLNFTDPSVTLIQFCSFNEKVPGQPTNLRAMNITFNEVLLLWNDRNILSKCIKTYIVQFCAFPCRRRYYKRINKIDTIQLSFHHVLDDKKKYESVRGIYKVKAIDFWNRTGRSSSRILYV